MPAAEKGKTLIQCDFDGTVTLNDVSFLILDAYGNKNWRQLYNAYRDGKISVGRFNTEAFAAVKAEKQTLLDFIKGKAELRAGFPELVAYCRRKGFRLVIVSNGLDFYIQSILEGLGLGDVEFYAARTRFGMDGVEARYIGPAGNVVEDDFKDAYLELFQKNGYRVIYVGNGASDASPASRSAHIFATDELLKYCQGTNLSYTPFSNFRDVIKGLESL